MSRARKHGYLNNPGSFGWQPPHRATTQGTRNGLLFHAYGCRVDGGDGLPHGVCEKCQDTASERYFRALMRIDKRAR